VEGKKNSAHVLINFIHVGAEVAVAVDEDGELFAVFLRPVEIVAGVFVVVAVHPNDWVLGGFNVGEILNHGQLPGGSSVKVDFRVREAVRVLRGEVLLLFGNHTLGENPAIWVGYWVAAINAVKTIHVCIEVSAGIAIGSALQSSAFPAEVSDGLVFNASCIEEDVVILVIIQLDNVVVSGEGVPANARSIHLTFTFEVADSEVLTGEAIVVRKRSPNRIVGARGIRSAPDGVHAHVWRLCEHVPLELVEALEGLLVIAVVAEVKAVAL